MKDIKNKLIKLRNKNKYLYYIFKYRGCFTAVLLGLIFSFKPNEIIGNFSLLLIVYSTYVGGYMSGSITMIISLFFITDMSYLLKGEITSSVVLLSIILNLAIFLMDYINNDRRVKEFHLSKKQKLYLNILNYFSDGIVVLDYKNVVFCNKFCANMLGKKDSEDLLKDKNNSYENICSELDIKEELTKNRNKKIAIFTKEIDKDNIKRIYKFYIVKKTHYKKEVIVILIYDITKKIVYERSLLKAENSYNNLVQNISNGIILHDNKKIIFANNTILQTLKVESLDDIKNKYIDDFIMWDYKVNFNRQVDDVINKNISDIKSTYLKLIDKEKNIIEVEVSTALMPYSDKKMVTLFNNKTEAKELYEEKKLINDALKYEKMKLEFFANMSHEFKTPLNILFTSIQTIELYLKTSKIVDNSGRLKKYLKAMKQNCYRQLRLINNLIDISKLDAGFYEMSYKNVNIVEVIENISLSIVDYAEQKGIEVIFDTEEEEIIIAVDEEKIERIILNLLSNAVKFTDKGDKIMIKVTNDANNVYISVKDTGIGIKQDELEIVFDRFKQAHNNTMNKGQGSGIGLSLVKSLVDLHNGSIDIKSEEFIGTEFIITFPIVLINSNNDGKECEESLDKNSNIEKINVEFSDIYY